MGKVEIGILDNLSGRVGPIVGAVVNDTNVIRKKPAKSNVPPVQRQLEQMAKFKTVSAFVKLMAKLIKMGYQHQTKNNSERNVATSYLLLNAITGQFPAYTLDYPAVILSKGDLPGAFDMAVSEGEDHTLKLSWSLDEVLEDERKERSTDRCYVAFYSETRKLYIPSMGKASRADLTVAVPVISPYRGTVLHGWAFFVAEDGKSVSDSIYLGAITPKV